MIMSINKLILALHADGCSCAQIARELGWNKPKTKRKLNSLGITTGHATRASRARAAQDDLGPDLSYTVQIKCGHGSPLLEFRYRLTYPALRNEEAQEVEA